MSLCFNLIKLVSDSIDQVENSFLIILSVRLFKLISAMELGCVLPESLQLGLQTVQGNFKSFLERTNAVELRN